MRYFRNRRGLSPAIGSIIMLAVTVVVSINVASWMGSMTNDLMSIEEFTIVDCQWAEDLSYADLTISNHGTNWLVVSNYRINEVEPERVHYVSGSSKIDSGESEIFRLFQNFNPSTKYQFKILSAKGNEVNYVDITSSIVGPSLHYINSISNVDNSQDKGTHNIFANQQNGPDSIFDTLTEEDFGSGLTNVIQYPTSSSSNVDAKEDDGTESNFDNSQDIVPNGDFMTIQEENTGGTGGYPSVRSKTHSSETSNTDEHDVYLPNNIEAGDTLLVVFVCDDNEQISWEDDDWTVIYEEDRGNSGPTMSIAWKKADGDEDGTTIEIETGSDEESVHMSYAIQNAADPTVLPPEASLEASGTNSNPNPASLSPSGGSNTYLWFAFYGCDDDDMASGYPSTYMDNRETYESSSGSGTCAVGAASREYTSSSDNPGSFTISSEQWEAATVAIYPGASGDNYELDFEYQWISADFDETDEQVCIYVQTASQNGEHLVAYEWNGAIWEILGTLSSDGWNNFTTSYITGTTYTINIIDENKVNDVSQSSWDIDCIITDCSSIDTNFELDIEVQFTDINVGRGYNEICIYMGSVSGEDLDCYIWNGNSWDILTTDLVQNQWNNVTRAINEENITLRFVGTSETDDNIQDSWEIDCCLLYAPAD